MWKSVCCNSQLKNGNRQPAGVVPIQPIEAHSRVLPNGPSPRRVLPARNQEQPQIAVEDASWGLVNKQAQVPASIPLGRMGKG